MEAGSGDPAPSEAEVDALYGHQAELILENELLRQRLRTYEESGALRVASRLTRLANVVLPAGSTRRRLAGTVVRRLRREPTPALRARRHYQRWLAARTPTPDELAAQRQQSAGFRARPLVSICMPVRDPDLRSLREAVGSVLSQTYDQWELCVGDDGSRDPGIVSLLEELASDPRVRLVRTEESHGISAATNRALAQATGEFVAFLDHDDVLASHVLFRYVERLQTAPDTDVFYCDEDLLLPDGERALPFFKPAWSDLTLLSMNVVTHFVMARRRLVEEVGLLRSERDGAQDFDLLLRLSDRTSKVCHVPEVLYSWRQSEDSTARSAQAKPWAYEAGRAAVADALARRRLDGTVEMGAFPGAYRVRLALPSPAPHVEILIPTRDRVDLLRRCIESIRAHTSYPSYAITVIDNDSAEHATTVFLDSIGCRVVPAPGPFNYAAIMNRGFAETDSEFLVTLNNDTTVLDDDWLEDLLRRAVHPDVGAVGCRLVFADGRPQHEGIVIGLSGPAANVRFDAPGIRVLEVMPVVREVTAVTGACCLVRRAAWEAVGGFDERFRVAYNDVDFCLRLRRQGYRILYVPDVTLVHEESSSRGDLHPPEDEALLVRTWASEILAGDPFLSPLVILGRQGLEPAEGPDAFRGRTLAQIAARR